MTLTRREKYMIAIGLIVVLLAAYIVYFLMPYLEDTGAARQRQTAAQSRLNILNAQAVGIGAVQSDVAALEASLKEREGSIATGMDHAKVLLYLEELTRGRAVDVSIQAAPDQPVQSRFLTQAVTMEFRTSWPAFIEIMEALKKNGLYNRAAYLKTEYRPVDGSETAPGATDGTPAATTADKNIIAVHLELVFYAFEPAEGQQPEPPVPPAVSDRKDDLFPAK